MAIRSIVAVVGKPKSSAVRVLVLLFAAKTFSRVILLVNLQMIGLGYHWRFIYTQVIECIWLYVYKGDKGIE